MRPPANAPTQPHRRAHAPAPAPTPAGHVVVGRTLHHGRLAASTTVALTLVLAACGRGQGGDMSDAGRAPRDTVAIGVALDPERPGMESIYQGVALAVAELNADRGSSPVIVMRRTPDGVSSAVAVAAGLQRDPGVMAVVGHPESGTSLEALPVYEDVEHGGRHAVAIVSPTATSPQLTGRSPWFFRVCPTDLAASQAVARYVRDSLGLRRASVIYRNDSYGRDWTSSFAAAFEQSGGTLLQRDPYVKDATEWEAYAAYIRQLGSEVLLFPGSVEDAVLAIRALRAAGAGNVAFVGGDATSGLEEEGAEFAGARYTTFFDPRRPATSTATSFIAAFQRAHGHLPDQRAALAYDAAMLIGLAIREVGPDRARIRAALAAVGRDRPAFEGAAGRIAFDARNDVVDKPVVVSTVAAR